MCVLLTCVYFSNAPPDFDMSSAVPGCTAPSCGVLGGGAALRKTNSQPHSSTALRQSTLVVAPGQSTTAGLPPKQDSLTKYSRTKSVPVGGIGTTRGAGGGGGVEGDGGRSAIKAVVSVPTDCTVLKNKVCVVCKSAVD